MLFTRLIETEKRTERFVHNCENYRLSEGGRGPVSVCVSGKEGAASVDMIVSVSGLEKLAVSL